MNKEMKKAVEISITNICMAELFRLKDLIDADPQYARKLGISIENSSGEGTIERNKNEQP